MSAVNKIVVCVFIVLVSMIMNEKVLKPRLPEVPKHWTRFVSRVNSSIRNTDIFSPFLYIVLALLGFLTYHLYNLVFLPLDRVKLLGDLGYQKDGKFSLKEIADSVKKRRNVGDVPPVYPNGWFAIIESWNLTIGETKNIYALGQELAVFRVKNGEAHVLDAYCPHMGANLAVGGQVVGDCLQCPFHGWKFRGQDGKCIGIPYADKIPDKARIKSWKTVEVNGWIHIWYHAEGLEPYWTIPEMEEITNGTLRYKGRTEHHVNVHIEEIPENAADVAHLTQVHRPFYGAGYDLNRMRNKFISWAEHEWKATWSQRPSPDGHIGCTDLTHDLKVFGYSLLPFYRANVKAMQIGPGIMYLKFDSFFGKGIYVQSVVPVEPMVQKLVHNMYIHWAVPNFIAKFFMLAQAIQAERDVMIWNNKKYQANPVVAKSIEDSWIARHRRWYSQFYSEHSPRLKIQKELLDW